MNTYAQGACTEPVGVRILGLRKQIGDTAYVENAIQQIARALSRRIAEGTGNRANGTNGRIRKTP
ncbi:hypothetical protein [Treponema endosymbiont of Eucomonympha sp.]|uniref:hypothetical protein n=1 Tax=Treponema endosymbiont of Eucomonympha sp. TaxID=1580831 RepID=UPI00139677FF|nr:hypothetical protein [Treponema endosymbiont of Eucomonympha sp.]